MHLSLENKIALVTGASRGIGKAIAMTLGEANATVIGTATTQTGADKISGYFQEHDIKGQGFKLDVTEADDVDGLITDIRKTFGAINILVNNAAITHDNLCLRMKDEEWQKVLDTDLTSVFRISRACLRDMLKARWGRIITIGSVVGTIGNPGQANYCAAKAGVIGFSKSLALEVGSRNITVNVVSPGYIETDMTNVMTEEQQKAIFARIPLQKPGKSQDVAAAVVFLASSAADYITGQTLHVNGGMFLGS